MEDIKPCVARLRRKKGFFNKKQAIRILSTILILVTTSKLVSSINLKILLSELESSFQFFNPAIEEHVVTDVVSDYQTYDDTKDSSPIVNIPDLIVQESLPKIASNGLNNEVTGYAEDNGNYYVSLDNGRTFNVKKQSSIRGKYRTYKGDRVPLSRLGCSVCAAYAIASYYTGEDIDIGNIFKAMGSATQYWAIERMMKNGEIKINKDLKVTYDGEFSGATYIGKNTDFDWLWETCYNAWKNNKAVVFTVAQSKAIGMKDKFGYSSKEMNDRTGIVSKTGHYIVVFGLKGDTPDSEMIFADSTGKEEQAFDKCITFRQFYNYYIANSCGINSRYTKKFEIFGMNNINFESIPTISKN